jgi:methyl-accepting chemotaxis protein
MSEQAKTSADQVGEIRKLVQDAQEKLDQVSRALRTLEDRIERDQGSRPRD